MTNSPNDFNRPRILLATGNRAKQETLRWLLEGLPLTPVAPAELGLSPDVDETGETHEEIARRKAADWSRVAGMTVIASDGGLVIPALGANWESRYTHRFAGLAADDGERTRRLLELMRPYRGEQRAASWMESVAIADRGEALASWELTGATGVIADQPGPSGDLPGFWVFSVWHFPQFDKLYVELSDAEKESLNDHWVQLKRLVQGYFSQ